MTLPYQMAAPPRNIVFFFSTPETEEEAEADEDGNNGDHPTTGDGTKNVAIPTVVATKSIIDNVLEEEDEDTRREEDIIMFVCRGFCYDLMV